MQKVEVGGMVVQWHYQAEQLIIDATAPDIGWVGIGFNVTDDISKASLIMAGVDRGKTYLSERFVIGPGQHQTVKALGGAEVVKLILAETNDQSTHIRFSIPVNAVDRFHYSLLPGQAIYLICAFSMEDDLQHHSRMRQHLKIKL